MSSRLAVFDFDGTIVDTLGDIVSSLNEARGELGLAPEPASVVRSWIGEGVDHLIAQALPPGMRVPETHSDLLRRYRAVYARRMFESSALYPGIVECLDALGASGVRLMVCSNKTEGFVTRMLDHFELTRRFERVVGGDSLPFRKPDARVLEELATGFSGVTWMIGDSAVDVATGRAFGARTVGCAYGFRGRAELVVAGAEVIVDAPAEIAPLFV